MKRSPILGPHGNSKYQNIIRKKLRHTLFVMLKLYTTTVFQINNCIQSPVLPTDRDYFQIKHKCGSRNVPAAKKFVKDF
jgi:hypothetical protein